MVHIPAFSTSFYNRGGTSVFARQPYPYVLQKETARLLALSFSLSSLLPLKSQLFDPSTQVPLEDQALP